MTSIHLAVIGGQKEIVVTLIARGAKIDISDFQGQSPLHLAVEKDYISIAELLIANGAEINARAGAQGFTPLYFVQIARNAGATQGKWCDSPHVFMG